MRYLEICMTLLMISLVLNLFSFTNILPQQNNGMYFKNPLIEPMNATGEFVEPDGFADKIKSFNVGSNYITALLGTDSNLFLAGGGDFLRAFYYLATTVIGGTVLVYPTLRVLGVPQWLCFIIVVPVYFMYALAIIQFISKNSTESST